MATSATPEQVQDVFPRCRLIGRRFRLAHVRKRGALIEVATFRGVSDPDDGRNEEHGRILRDNVFGTVEEDALRRDFTINALFLDPVSGDIRDYVGGYQDLADRRLRLIGDPAVRYREDPVRLLRAARFVAKLGVEPYEDTASEIPELAPLLEHVPPARLFEEVCKLFMTGHGMRSMEALQRFGLSTTLFPGLRRGAGPGKIQLGGVLSHSLQNTDERVQRSQPVTPAFLFAALLWQPVEARSQALVDAGESAHDAMMVAAEEANARRLERLVEEGAKLVREATKNPDFEAATLERLAEDLQALSDIAATRMPSVADLLAQAEHDVLATAILLFVSLLYHTVTAPPLEISA